MNKEEEDSKSLEFIMFAGDRQKVLIRNEISVLELANNNKIILAQSCGGNASCGTCLVKVKGSLLPPRNECEQEISGERGFLANERLACQLFPEPQMEIFVPANDLLEKQKKD